ncbi:Thiol:disulfide interchange protein DsbD precursor [Gallibacterium anatis]|uniref:Thiol:disulfide interchange protein DsbD n=1 Tax=Gallibacterium anatis TaxID=750 RepID=A0A377H7G6_9PAST|nr:protein-disulfide reductase DsbD [Gallibacterium anatis]KGQ54347.1 thiol:disulfide interchange protein [Gallibacterium anatis DSM 16844 = F 149]STO38444.1 Thiol:disulfide interchange protein DsbD precursor [Gallibacterium anatis]
MIKKYWQFFCTVFLISLFSSAYAGLFDKKTEFLTAEQAFPFSVQAQPQQIILHWEIQPNYYLYKHTIQVTGENVAFTQQIEPTIEKSHQDPYFGNTQIYEQGLEIKLLPKQQVFQAEGSLEVSYQGCTDGLCYPPQTRQIQLAELLNNTPSNTENTNITTDPETSLTQQLFQSKYAAFWFFMLGIGLAFTPCVLPMLPLLSALVIGQKQRANTAKALLLSVVYVQGMAFTYALLGLAVAAVGLSLQAWLQSPYVLSFFALLFVLLACSMFGLFHLQIPSSWQTKLNTLSQKQSAGVYGGVFVMGAIAGLIASPCTSAPLSAALLYVTQSGDLLTGALTLYLLALGMGVPLIAITVFGNKILPKAGAWLENVKVAFGFVLLALPIILLSRILPPYWEQILWSLLGIAFFIWFITIVGKAHRFWLLVALIGIVLSAAPLYFSWQQYWQNDNGNNENDTFITVTSLDQLQQQLRQNPHQIAMVDLYADWCVACKEFEHKTFNQPQVQQKLAQILLIRVDMTKNSVENQIVSKKYNVLGLPTILFFDQQGNEIEDSRITGFLEAQPFLDWLQKIQQKQ